MAVDVRQLVQVAPLPADVKARFLARVDALSAESRSALAEICWDLLAQAHHQSVRHERDKAVADIALGKRATPFYLHRVEEGLVSALALKLRVPEHEVRKHVTCADAAPGHGGAYDGRTLGS